MLLENTLWIIKFNLYTDIMSAYKYNTNANTGCLVLKFMGDIFNSAQPVCPVLPVDQINPATQSPDSGGIIRA